MCSVVVTARLAAREMMVVVELVVGLVLMMIEAEVRKAEEVVVDASSQLPAYSRTQYQIKFMQYRIQVYLNRT